MKEKKEKEFDFPYLVYIQFEESKKPYSFGAHEKYHVNDMVVVETRLPSAHPPATPWTPAIT